LPLKIFRAEQRPNEVNQHAGRNDAAEYQVKHDLNLFTAFDVKNEENKHENSVEHGDSVTHGRPTFRPLICACPRKAATGKTGRGHKDSVKKGLLSMRPIGVQRHRHQTNRSFLRRFFQKGGFF
jgi:hypothetical protein